MKLSFFIPIHNEEVRLRDSITKIYAVIEMLVRDLEIFIVADNSKDNSKRIAKELASTYPNIEYTAYTNGPSRRENLADSFKLGKSTNTAFIDVDLANCIKYLKVFLDEMENGADICIASRYMGIPPKRSIHRKSISKAYNHFLRFYFNSEIRDHQCGFKMFNTEILKELVREMGYDTKLKRGWFWDAELLIRSQKKGLSIKEIPIKWEEGEKSSFDLKREAMMIPYVLKFKI